GGIYLGVHGGYADADVDFDLSRTEGAVQHGDPFDPSTRTIASEGGVAGLQTGFNIQAGRAVFGLEADISLSDLEKSDKWLTSDSGPAATKYCRNAPCTAWDVTTDIPAFGTLRARAGFLLHDNLL